MALGHALGRGRRMVVGEGELEGSEQKNSTILKRPGSNHPKPESPLRPPGTRMPWPPLPRGGRGMATWPRQRWTHSARGAVGSSFFSRSFPSKRGEGLSDLKQKHGRGSGRCPPSGAPPGSAAAPRAPDSATAPPAAPGWPPAGAPPPLADNPLSLENGFARAGLAFDDRCGGWGGHNW